MESTTPLPKALVVDDESIAFEFITFVLGKTLHMTFVDNTKDAISSIASNTYDVVITDGDHGKGVEKGGVPVVQAAIQNNVRIIIGMSNEEENLDPMKQAGAHHILLKYNLNSKIIEKLLGN